MGYGNGVNMSMSNSSYSKCNNNSGFANGFYGQNNSAGYFPY